jgi:tetratricopeptide (TPR) repeat protein
LKNSLAKQLFLLLNGIILFACISNNASAQNFAKGSSFIAPVYDSLNTTNTLEISDAGYVAFTKKIPSLRSAKKTLALAEIGQNLPAKAAALLSLGEVYIAHGNNRKAFICLTDALRLKDAFKNDDAIYQLYYNFAIVFARLKQYSYALKCFFKTDYVYQQTFFKRKRKKFFQLDTTGSFHTSITTKRNIAEDSVSNNPFSDAVIDETILRIDTVSVINNPIKEESPYNDFENIIAAFNDGKQAFSYALMIHVKQPVPGKANIFVKLSKVGHTFITLTKFNADGTEVSRTFGFYPEKDNPLSATPLMPSTNSAFKDDVLHDWDEVIAKYISQNKFEKILAFINETGNKRYNLNHNNCTDFALKIGAIANIEIKDTKGFWPLGRGNNPATTGQSILRGKFTNLETASQRGLFACSNNLFISPNQKK